MNETMNRFLTPQEAGKMSAAETEQFEDCRSKINGILSSQFVPGSPDPIRFDVPDLRLRVSQKLREGLEAAGWTVTIRGDNVTIIEKVKSGPLYVDRRTK